MSGYAAAPGGALRSRLRAGWRSGGGFESDLAAEDMAQQLAVLLRGLRQVGGEFGVALGEVAPGGRGAGQRRGGAGQAGWSL